MYLILEARVRAALRDIVKQKYGVDAAPVTERPPKVAMGELASPLAFELAKRLKRAPRQIAQEIAGAIGQIEGVSRVEVAGAGYLNFFFDRGGFFAGTLADSAAAPVASDDAPKSIVEHTNINPNKAAHIGHLRNAALGDTFVRLLRRAGRRVEVQNYIDNTGVQVADVVVGFERLEHKSADDVRRLTELPRFDYLCWDLYARVTQFFEEDKSRLALRGEALKAIEEGHGPSAKMAEIVSTAVLRAHLKTMLRLGIEYDLLPRESEILHLKFWDAAFEQLKEKKAIHKAESGKNAGCWVMRMDEPGATGSDDDAKIIVRSDGTVTYVGKDIAYQLWKFGLLGRDFHYQPFERYADGRSLWMTTSESGAAAHPAFGHAAQVYNVIDARQAYLQRVVVAGLRALGFDSEADRSTHFSYEIVALTPRCAAEMGYVLSDDDQKRPYVEVSGRKGMGVKADDLLDRLEAAARAEVDSRHGDSPEAERAAIASAVAIGALRYFLLRFTRSTIIAFDFKDALSFEGETGPYCQYAVVRIRNIFRKLEEQNPDASAYAPTADARGDATKHLEDDVWELVLLADSLETQIEAALGAQEPAFIAKYSFQLAQAFNLFYHKHHILSEADSAKKRFLLDTAALVERKLVAALDILGIEAPEKM
ncbi:MAG: arginine--tRNA ligase [Candidatus Acidiferrales bacterium]